MALKGINPIEQHFDKAIAAVFGVALLGVVAWQFLAKSTVKVGQNEVPIAEAYPLIDKEARKSLARLEQANLEPPEIKDDPTAAIGQFESRFKGPVAPAPQLPIALGTPPPPLTTSAQALTSATRLPELRLEAPPKPSVATYLATVDTSEVTAHPEVAAVLPKEQPFDKAAVTIETTFDGAALRSMLETVPEGGAAAPRSWWDGAVQILGMELVRQERQPDGSWGPEAPVGAMPGRQPLPTPLAQIQNQAQLRDAVKVATDSPATVRRPEFYRVRFGEKWMTPVEREAMVEGGAEGADKIARLNAQLDREKRTLERIKVQIERAGRPAPPPPGGGGGGGGGRGGGGKGPGGGGGGGGGGGAPPAPTGPDTKLLLRNLDQSQRRIDNIVAQLRALGAIADAPGQAAAPPKPEAPLLDNTAVRVWVHDVFAERGRTYRYRASVVLSNPYFGHAAAMLPEQAELAAAPLIRSAHTEWSEPVQVEPETFWFITSATTEDNVARTASAKAEVFQFKWGHWRRGSTTLEPGDTIEAEIKVPDLSAVAAVPLPDQPPAPGQPPPGGGGGGGRKGPAGGGGGVGGGAGPGAPPAPPPPNPGEPKPEAVKTAIVQVSSPSIMLAVATTTSSASREEVARGAVEQVFLSDQGQVVVRVPREERESQAYLRVARSADQGERELQRISAAVPAAAPPGRDPNPGGPPPGRDR